MDRFSNVVFMYLAVVILLLMLGYAFYVDGYPVSSRISEPPVEVTDPNELKWRTDICNGIRNYPRTNPESDGETSS